MTDHHITVKKGDESTGKFNGGIYRVSKKINKHNINRYII